jgi:hypothetical protein
LEFRIDGSDFPLVMPPGNGVSLGTAMEARTLPWKCSWSAVCYLKVSRVLFPAIRVQYVPVYSIVCGSNSSTVAGPCVLPCGFGEDRRLGYLIGVRGLFGNDRGVFMVGLAKIVGRAMT